MATMKILFYFFMSFALAYSLPLEGIAYGYHPLPPEIYQLLASQGEIQLPTTIDEIPSYYIGEFRKPFNPALTTTGTFFTSDGSAVEVPMIFQPADVYSYSESDELDAKILEIPFEDESVLRLVLPTEREGIVALEKKINTVAIKAQFSLEEVEVKLPRMRHYAYPYFTINEGGSQVNRPEGCVNPDRVANITANPNGFTHAKEFIADHPFKYYFINKGTVYFEGTVLNPLLVIW